MANKNIPISSVVPLPPPILPPNVPTGDDRCYGGGRPSLLESEQGRTSRLCLSATAPPPPHEASPYSTNTTTAAAATIDKLVDQGYTRGLAEAVQRSKQVFQLFIWVVDNSGSMQHTDGHRIVQQPQPSQKAIPCYKLVPCTRWAEMQQTVEYHAMVAAQLQCPTVFRLLNDPGRAAGEQQFSIAQRGPSFLDDDIAVARRTMKNTSPCGVTPLIPHVEEIRDNIRAMEPQLRSNGTKVALVLATDGLPTDHRGVSDDQVRQQFVEALRSLEGLPVWLVVRLCTDDDEVVQFWNSLDNQLELSLEVLDDFLSEATEIQQHNPWLNYGLPIHRMREMGFHNRLFDLLDERPLTRSELRDFFRILWGDGNMDGVPDPEVDWQKFYDTISKLVHKEQKAWNPISKQVEPYIDLSRLRKEYGGDRGWFCYLLGL